MNSKKISIIILSLSIIVNSSLCLAEEVNLPLNIDSTDEILGTMALILSNSKVNKINEIETKVKDKSNYVVSFNIPRTEYLNESTFVTALGLTKTNNIVLSDIQHPSKITNLPICKDKNSVSKSISGKHSLLLSLIKVRETRRNVLQKKIGERVSKGLSKEIYKLEKLFGLGDGSLIIGSENPYKLHERLYRLMIALKNFKMHSSK